MPSPKTAIGFILFCSLTINALAQSTFYAASRSGLNLREQASSNAPVVTKIPYGAKVTKAADSNPGELVTEGMSAQWMRVQYEGRPGYVANVYLLPFAPPATPNNGDLLGYLKGLSPQVGSSKKMTGNSPETGETSVERHVYQNGICYRVFSGYEYGAETIWLPGITLQQGFVLARLLSPEQGLLSMSDVFPNKSTEGESPSRHSVRLTQPYPGSDWVSAIHYEWCEAGCYQLEIRYEEGEVSITIASGV